MRATQVGVGLLALITGCITEGTTPRVDPPIEPPLELSPIERCVLEGGTLRELWSTGNQHGAVTSIAVGGTTVVLGSEDGSVKIWDVDGTIPAYGTPLLDDTGIAFDGLAFGTGGSVLGVARDGRLSEWRLSDAHPTRTTQVVDGRTAAVAASPDGELVAVVEGLTTSGLRIVARARGEVSPPLTTTLWGASSAAFAGDHLFTAGHWYGVPQIERRAQAAPDEVIETWLDHALTANVRALAIDPAASRLVAAGDGFIAVLVPQDLAGDTTIVHEIADHVAVGAVLLGRDLFATVGSEGALHVWSPAATLVQALATAPAVGIGIDAAHETLFTAGPDGMLRAFGCR